MKLTAEKLERLAILAEECAEVQHIIMKTIRHGEDSCHPDDLDTTNKMMLSQEVADLVFAITMCIEDDDIDGDIVQECFDLRYDTINEYLHYNEIN